MTRLLPTINFFFFWFLQNLYRRLPSLFICNACHLAEVLSSSSRISIKKAGSNAQISKRPTSNVTQITSKIITKEIKLN